MLPSSLAIFCSRPSGSMQVRGALRSQRGVALVTALIFLGLMSVLAAAYTMAIRADTALRGGAARERKSFYAAEAGLNYAMGEVRQYFEHFTSPGSYQNSIAIASGAHQRTVDYVVSEVPGRNPGPPELILAGQPFAGLHTIPSDYIVTSTSSTTAGDKEAMLGAQFTINSVPLFQFMAFYEDTLDVQNAPPMNVSGRIHTNGDLYLNTWSTLTIGDRRSPPGPPPDNPFVHISAAGNVYRGGLVDNCMGTVTIDKQADTVAPSPDLDPLVLPCTGAGPNRVDDAARAAFLGSLLAHVPPLQVPDNLSLDRGDGGDDGGIFWQRADLRIVLNRNATRVQNFCGLALPSSATANGLYAIEVQNADGSRDATKTAALWQFMCERRGAIFYTDLPIGEPAAMPMATAPPNPSTANDPSNPNNYDPPFCHAAAVYRRAGEDTNGDGVVDVSGDGTVSNNDRNDDICPIAIGPAPIGPRPEWRPDFCNVRLAQWIPGTAGNGNRFDTIVAARTAAAGGAPGTPPASSWYLDADYRRGGFYNWREQKWVMMLNVNIRALIDWNEANGAPLFPPNDTTDGGLVFFLSVQANDSTSVPPPANLRYGVRVFDAANLNTRGGTFLRPNPDDPTGLTVVSDQAIHIQGNYNYYPTMTLATKLPAAVMGDTINIFSQSWEVPIVANVSLPGERQYNNDRKTPQARSPVRAMSLVDGYFIQHIGLMCADGPCTSFAAANTFGINAGFISGTVPSQPGIYGGGLENYPRFFEGWKPGGNQQTLTYAGSFVSLGIPQYANGAFQGGGSIVYDPPARNWDYDASFNNVKLLPPLTPRVNLLQQRMFTRFYQ
ncbi:MAG: hypothetical protein AB7P18_16010 [Candidatus Binatia bacterium]